MELKLFTDLIDALGKVVAQVKAFTSFSRAQRDKYRLVMEDTCRLIDTTLNMVIIRLGDILAADKEQDFMQEVIRLDNYDDWINAEREFRLCKSLRIAVRETETLSNKIAGAVSTADWEALLSLMHGTLVTEGEVALFISVRFRALAETARSSTRTLSEITELKKNVSIFRNLLIKERQELIRQEIELYSIV